MGKLNPQVVKIGQTISPEQESVMIKPFSSQEVKSIHYRSMKMVLKVVHSKVHLGHGVPKSLLMLFENGNMLEQSNATVLTLIPNVDNPLNDSEFELY